MERLGRGSATAAFGGDGDAGLAEGVEEEFLADRLLDEVFFGRAEDFHDAGELLLLVFAGEDGVAGEELGEDATETPHVDGEAVAHAQNDFRRAVEAGLNVGIYLFVFEAAGAKVDDFDF